MLVLTYFEEGPGTSLIKKLVSDVVLSAAERIGVNQNNLERVAIAYPENYGKAIQDLTDELFTPIELCGSFLRGKTGIGTTKPNFLKFCKSKYMPTEYETLAELLYSIFRNGVAHSYIPKGAAIPSSNKKDENMHLEYCSDGLFIYVPQLANDVTKAIQDFYNHFN